MSKLPIDFYQGDDVLAISRALLGKILFSKINGEVTSGIIVETEAYKGIIDKASHSYKGKYTDRTRIMYNSGGQAYVYLCYGVHHLFNVVTNIHGIPDAVLIRAIQPIKNIETMLKRRKIKKLSRNLTAGPGILSQAMGIDTSCSGISLLGNKIWIEHNPLGKITTNIISRPRVGISYAGKDALNLWRYSIADNFWVSSAK